MTDIEWGAEIAVNGVRPEWLTGVQTAWLKTSHWTTPNHFPHVSAEKWSWRYGSDGRPCITAIRLPADHDYYKATSRGFTYWPGGESTPEDWDKSPVLLRDGEIWPHTDATEWQELGTRTVIGYRKRTDQPEPIIAPELVERAFNVVRRVANGGDNGTWWKDEARAILAELEPDPDLTLAKSIVGDAEAIALAIKAARENGRG